MLQIYLARHGQNEDNAEGLLNGHRDRPLTEKGREQAREVALKIKEEKILFDHIYSSPLGRAIETAQTIATVNNFAIPEIYDGLIERDFGKCSGQNCLAAAEAARPDILETATVKYLLYPEGGETFPQLLERGRKIIEFVQSRHSDGTILLVGHGDIGKMIYAAYYNLAWEDVLKLFHFGNCELVLLSSEKSADLTHVFTIEQHNL